MTVAPGGKRAANRERVRGELAVAAMHLFDEHGFDTITVDEIADAVGISRRTLFRHFPTKSDIVFADHPDRIVRLREFLVSADPDQSPLDVTLASAVDTIPSFTDPADFYLLRYRLLKLTPELLVREQAYGVQYTRVLARYLRPELAALGVEDDAALLGDALASSIVTVVNRAQRKWAASGGAVDAVAVTSAGVAMLKRAFGPLVHPNSSSGSTVIVMSKEGISPEDLVQRLESVLKDP